MRIPKVLTGLGTVREIEITDNDGQLHVFTFALKLNFQLTTNSTGTALFIFPAKKKKTIGATTGQMQRQISRAVKMYEKWSDFEPDGASAHSITEKRLTNAGKAHSITYRSDKWSGKLTNYIHRFESPNVRVLMDDTENPKMIQIHGGRMKVKKEGITG